MMELMDSGCFRTIKWTDKGGKTPLMVACMSHKLYDAAKTLIESGADVNRYRRETVYHSSGVLSSLSSSWTSKPPLAVKYQFELTSIGESEDSKSSCSSLERLLAWEKELYEEVKMERSRHSVEYHEKSRRSIDRQLERARKSVDWLDRIHRLINCIICCTHVVKRLPLSLKERAEERKEGKLVL